MAAEGSIVSISTLPANAQFYVGQTIQFTCETNTTTTVSYQWNYFKAIYDGFRSNDKTITITFDQNNIFRYIWVFCTVSSSSGDVLGQASKLVEVHGKL